MTRIPKPKPPAYNPLGVEGLSGASPDRVACQRCKLFQTCQTPFLLPYVPKDWTGLLLLVGEAPGEDEDERSGEPFTGRAGRLLSSLLVRAGYGPTDVAMVNAVRCRPGDNRTPHMPEVRACRPFLARVIQRLRPQYLIALGVTAAKSLSNEDVSVTKLRGRLSKVAGGLDVQFTTTYHPTAVLHGKPELEPIILDDLRWPFKPELQRPDWGVSQGSTSGLDTEWGADHQLLTVGLANPTTAWAWEGEECTSPDLKHRLSSIQRFVTHSGSDDLDLILPQLTPQQKSGVVSGETWSDTLLCSRLVDETKPSYGLENLLCSTFRVPEWKSSTQPALDMYGDASLWSSNQRRERCALDAWATAVLLKKINSDSPGLLTSPLALLTHRQAQAIHRIKLSGTTISAEKLGIVKHGYEQNTQKWESLVIQQATAHGARLDFRPTNDYHIRELVYENLGYPVSEQSDSGLPSVDRETLTGLVRDGEPESTGPLEALLRFGREDKARDYADQLYSFSRPCGRRSDGCDLRFLSFKINPLGAKTGRRTSSEPNSQNLAEDLRHVFVSRWANGKIANFDYSGLEVVLIGWLAGDEKLLEAFTTGRKYLDVGKWMLGLDIQEGSNQYKLVKAAVLSLNYCKTPGSFGKDLIRKFGIQLSPDLTQHFKETYAIHQKYFRTFPGLRRYMDDCERELLGTGQVVSKTGRVRHLPVPDGTATPGYEHARNQAVNFKVQSLASDVTGCALVDVDAELCRSQGISLVDRHRELRRWYENNLTAGPDRVIIPPEIGSTVINEVHDSLVGDLHPNTLKRDEELFIETMCASKTFREFVPDFTPPLKVGATTDDFWRSKD